MGFIKVVVYRLKMLLTSPIYLIVLLGMPVTVVLFSGLVLNRAAKDLRIPIAIVDNDHSEYSRLVVERIFQKPSVKVQTGDMQDVIRKVSTGKYEAAYIIKKGFMERILDEDIEGLIEMVKSPSSISAEIIGEIISSEVIRLSSNVTAANYVVSEYKKMKVISGKEAQQKTWEEAWKYTDAQWEPKPLMTIEYKEMQQGTLKSGSGNKGLFHTLDVIYGMIISYLMFNMLVGGSWVITEKNDGIIKRIYSSPMKLSTYIMGNIFAVAIINFIGVSLMIYLLERFFSMQSIGLNQVYMLLIAYLLCLSSISLFLATILKSISQLQVVTPVTTLITSFFGGSFINLSEISQRFKQISMITPQHWFMEGLRKTYISGTGWGAGQQMLILLEGFILFFFLSIIVLKITGDR
ncbi:MAG: hypothetical protein JG777_1945 [Clostridia bacterium]|uniref:ABC transporter permease n=1 Tax=Petroclostridium xylanilyticum TaxID=1792311 RepID=UPI000B983942|nr:ABC transporter permease [Petroclostridium xylanilyticum]MBZ4646456.1 hypothetical protein [Clostridia bacterium]